MENVDMFWKKIVEGLPNLSHNSKWKGREGNLSL